MTRWHQREIDGLSRRAKKLSIPEDVLERFLPYRDNPSGFCQDILGVESAPAAFGALAVMHRCNLRPRVLGGIVTNLLFGNTPREIRDGIWQNNGLAMHFSEHGSEFVRHTR